VIRIKLTTGIALGSIGIAAVVFPHACKYEGLAQQLRTPTYERAEKMYSDARKYERELRHHPQSALAQQLHHKASLALSSARQTDPQHAQTTRQIRAYSQTACALGALGLLTVGTALVSAMGSYMLYKK
jgi:hypothetical protein